MLDCRELLKELFREARFFDSRDLLVNPERNPNKTILLSEEQNKLPFEGKVKNIIRESKAIKKESGNDALCITHDLIQIEGQAQFPLFLESCDFKLNKLNNEVELLRSRELILNPYLSVYLENLELKLGKGLEASLFETNIEIEFQDEIRAELQLLGIEIEREVSYLGNFHPHRFSHLKDLNKLIQGDHFSNALLQLSGDDYSENNALNLSKSFLFPSDTDQRKAIELSEKHNLALLGPPGTGKSQYLTNLLAKLVFSEQSTLVISEKRTALEVIQKRLKERNLDYLSSIQTTQSSSSEFVFQLKENWKKLEAERNPKTTKSSRFESLSANLQFYLDVLNQPETIGGLSLNDFLKLCSNPEEKGSFFLNPPAVQEFIDQTQSIELFYQNKKSNLLSNLQEQVIQNETSTAILDVLVNLQTTITAIQAQFGANSHSDIDVLVQRAAWAQVAQSEYYRKHRELFNPDSKKQKQILQSIKKWRKIDSELSSIETQKHWKRELHSEELKALQASLFGKSGLFNSQKRGWKKCSNAPFESAHALIADQLKTIELESKKSSLTAQIQAEGLDTVGAELILFEQWIKRFNTDEWREIQTLSTKIIEHQANVHDDLHRAQQQLKSYFKSTSLDLILEQIESILQSKTEFIALCELTKHWSKELLYLVLANSTFDELKNSIYHSHWLLFSELFPGMAHFNSSMLRDKLIELQKESEIEQELFAENIHTKQQAKFQHFETLLRTPANKLSNEEKELKVNLRKGKSLLSKEFAKKTRHIPLHALYNSEARLWIQVLVPIMLCNTEQVARAFPLEVDLFDVGIFDEASQVPLFTAVGAAQRCKKLVVAGDDQQMRPSRPFGSGKDEVVDLLSQALMYFKSSTLKHHYRSEHEDLIAFSNRHFYKNELIAYPSFPREKQVIQFIPCAGEYHDRKNEKEAKAIAKTIASLLSEKANFGVVAFSEEQISLIWNTLSPALAEKLQDAIDEDLAFVKAVDKVQGDECDHLLISFTFGFNKNGQFKYTFGPMSTAHGTNRLNVLLTRARKSIQFYASVSYADFRVTPNASVDLIRKYFAFMESEREESSIRFPYELQPRVDNNKLTFEHIGSSIQNAQELATLFNVLENRGWEVHFA